MYNIQRKIKLTLFFLPSTKSISKKTFEEFTSKFEFNELEIVPPSGLNLVK